MSGDTQVKTAHVFGMGFTQTLGGGSGQIALWRKARVYSSPDHVILPPAPWRTDPREIAVFLARLAPLRIYGYFYSWGAGWFGRRLIRALDELGLGFETIVLCDPVARSNISPDWLPLNITSLFSFHRIVIPPNVRQVHRLYQRVDKPCGHRLRIADPSRTVVLSDRELNVCHARMEDHDDYHALVLSTIQEATR